MAGNLGSGLTAGETMGCTQHRAGRVPLRPFCLVRQILWREITAGAAPPGSLELLGLGLEVRSGGDGSVHTRVLCFLRLIKARFT